MSAKIKILPANIYNKIAAGEVVQRPESVVKELLENSLDAEAKNIDVIVKRAGKTLIQVCDDGIGMSEEDAMLSVHKHATSKIESFEDLESIKTLGFRGEALSSIAAVSQLEIRTERKEDELGTHIKQNENGQLVVTRGSFAKGTCVIVKNLFYNTPARRKFLKTDTTELKHILDSFNKIALSHPSVSFKIYNGTEIIFDYPAGTLEERIKKVFAENMPDALVPVNEQTDFMNVSGFVGKPSLLKKSKGDQYLYLNNRYIINKNINHAVFTAYENILEKGDYPFFILFIQIDPQKIDVNIHPSKLEAKFEDEKDVYNFVLAVVRKSLASHDLVPAMIFSDEDMTEEKLIVDHFISTDVDDFTDRPITKQSRASAPSFSEEDIDNIFSSITDEIETTAGQPVPPPFTDDAKKEFTHYTEPKAEDKQTVESPFIVQLHNKYILSQIKSGLMIIDQHVAHERVLYEKALNRLETDIPFSQQLLFSKKIKLDPARYELLKELHDHFNRLGFQLKFSAKNNITIEGVPDDIKNGNEENLLLEILDEYSENSRLKKLEEVDNIAKSYSCKTAIKAGDNLSEKEMRLLIDQLFATSMPYVCPHGRPIVIKISLNEFDRRFGRT